MAAKGRHRVAARSPRPTLHRGTADCTVPSSLLHTRVRASRKRMRGVLTFLLDGGKILQASCKLLPGLIELGLVVKVLIPVLRFTTP